MGLFSKTKPTEPPAWQEHPFEPKADMTAQELGLILKLFALNPIGSIFLFPFGEDPDVFFDREVGMPQIGRHFGTRLLLLASDGRPS